MQKLFSLILSADWLRNLSTCCLVLTLIAIATKTTNVSTFLSEQLSARARRVCLTRGYHTETDERLLNSTKIFKSNRIFFLQCRIVDSKLCRPTPNNASKNKLQILHFRVFVDCASFFMNNRRWLLLVFVVNSSSVVVKNVKSFRYFSLGFELTHDNEKLDVVAFKPLNKHFRDRCFSLLWPSFSLSETFVVSFVTADPRRSIMARKYYWS